MVDLSAVTAAVRADTRDSRQHNDYPPCLCLPRQSRTNRAGFLCLEKTGSMQFAGIGMLVSASVHAYYA